MVLKFSVKEPSDRAGDFHECQTCHFLSFQSRVSLSAYPPEYYGGGARKIGGLGGVVRDFSVRKRSAEVVNRTGKPGRIFDFGCGDGDFLAAMHSHGWECFGSELEGPAYDRCAVRFPGRIVCGADGFAASSLTDNFFDAVSIWQVFEHLPDPRSLLGLVRRRMKPGGLFAIGVPDPTSWQAVLGGRHWLHLDPPRHLHLCSPAALESLLNESGFQVLGTRHPWVEYGPIGVVQTALNIAGFPRDRFFEAMKSGCGGRTGSVTRMLDVFCSCLLLAPAVAFSAIEATFRNSATFEMYARPS